MIDAKTRDWSVSKMYRSGDRLFKSIPILGIQERFVLVYSQSRKPLRVSETHEAKTWHSFPPREIAIKVPKCTEI